MNTTQQSVRVGLFFLLGCALAWITFEALGGGAVFKPQGYALVAPFNNLKGLKEGDEVLMAGVKIGTIGATRLGPQRVEAVLIIRPDVRIPEDAVATIETSSLLGSQHLAVSFGRSSVMLPEGALLRTRDTVDMNEVIAQLGSLGAKLEGVAGNIDKALGGQDGSGSLFSKLDRLVEANGPALTETIAHLRTLSARLESGEGALGQLVNDPRLHDELLGAVGELRGAAADARGVLADTRSIVADAKAGRGALGVLLADPAAAEDLRFTLNNLRSLSDKINRGEGTLGLLLADEKLYREIQGLVRKADRTLDGLGDQGPITAVGAVAGALF